MSSDHPAAPPLPRLRLEPEPAYRAFLLWALAGERRSIKSTARVMQKDPKQIREWRSRWEWDERVADRDDVELDAYLSYRNRMLVRYRGRDIRALAADLLAESGLLAQLDDATLAADYDKRMAEGRGPAPGFGVVTGLALPTARKQTVGRDEPSWSGRKDEPLPSAPKEPASNAEGSPGPGSSDNWEDDGVEEVGDGEVEAAVEAPREPSPKTRRDPDRALLRVVAERSAPPRPAVDVPPPVRGSISAAQAVEVLARMGVAQPAQASPDELVGEDKVLLDALASNPEAQSILLRRLAKEREEREAKARTDAAPKSKELMLVDGALGYVAAQIKAGKVTVRLSDLPTLLRLRSLLTGGLTGRVEVVPAAAAESVRLQVARSDPDPGARVRAMRDDVADLAVVLDALVATGAVDVESSVVDGAGSVGTR